MTVSSPSPLSESAPHTDPPSRLITASNLRELAICLSARCSTLRASPLTSLGSQGVAVWGVEEDAVSTSGGHFVKHQVKPRVYWDSWDAFRTVMISR